MKYNKSEIMKAAWNLYKQAQKWVSKLSFSVCLHRAWESAKNAIASAQKLAKGCTKMVNGVELSIHHAFSLSGREGWVITGNTFYARKEIKRAGFTWDAEAKYWYTTDRKVAEYFC